MAQNRKKLEKRLNFLTAQLQRLQVERTAKAHVVDVSHTQWDKFIKERNDLLTALARLSDDD